MRRTTVGQKQIRTMSFGVSYLNRFTFFKVQKQKAKTCYLNLYHTIDATKNARFRMEEGQNHIFTLCIKDLEHECYEYCFEDEEGTFLEPNAKVVLGRYDFGKRMLGNGVRAAFLSNFEDFEQDAGVKLEFHDMILYKLHIRGFTKHPSSKVEAPGTYQGVIEKIPYLNQLGVNAILCLPITEFDEMMSEKNLQDGNEKINYWGFEAPSYLFAPKASYANDSQHPDVELKQMIYALHQNQIAFMMEMNFPSNQNPALIIECLAYWHEEYHVDGFCVNLPEQYRRMIAASERLRGVKLLDAGWNIEEIRFYSGGESRAEIAEYNDQFLMDTRRFLKGEESMTHAFMNQMKYNKESIGVIHYLTNHDGFTMQDLYAYDCKHNETNGENNRDGREINFSWNCGAEGKTANRKVVRLRNQMIRNAFLVLFASQGTPMLLAGDEFGNTQRGNNNAYCQDNEISWLDWSLNSKNQVLFDWVQALIRLRKKHPVLHQENEMRASDYIFCGMPDISFHGVKAWQPDYSFYSREAGIMLCGSYVAVNRNDFDDTFYFIYNMHWEKHEFGLPNPPRDHVWQMLLTTDGSYTCGDICDQRMLMLAAHSSCVLVSKKVSKREKGNR